MVNEISKINSSEALQEQIDLAKEAAFKMSIVSESEKNKAIDLIARELLESTNYILEANKIDLEAGKAENLSNALLDRLKLDAKAINGMANALRKIINIKDPVGVALDGWQHPRGMQITKISVPLGLIGIIYEARPNVTTDAIGLCIKSGNSCVLRGSQQAWNTNLAIMDVVNRALAHSNIPGAAVQYLKDKSRESAKVLLQAKGKVDLVIPRGGNQLKDFVMANTLVPVLGAGGGLCHVYIDKFADHKKAIEIALNAKTQRPGVCNACETILLHEDLLKEFAPALISALEEASVEVLADESIRTHNPGLEESTAEDWENEYLDLKVSIKTVSTLAEAIEHINHYSTGHSDAIVTEDLLSAQMFKRTIDSSCVYVNASTRFTDGEEFGFGAEIGISTQKLHARGPIGLKELCTYKYIIEGSGQTR